MEPYPYETPKELTRAIYRKEIDFPYHRFFSLPKEELFANLVEYTPKPEYEKYMVRSYNGTSFLPPMFRGRYIQLRTSEEEDDNINALSSFYTEDERLSGKREDRDMSIIECWNDKACIKKIVDEAFTYDYITPKTLRRSINHLNPGLKIFRPTQAKSLVQIVMGANTQGKKMLDISAGWGDRLLTAMALGMDYLGYDPNTNLQLGHSRMIMDFGDATRHNVIYQPFEYSVLEDNKYDVVLTSPPFFKVEEYAPDQEGQSITTFNTLEEWLGKFLFVSLRKAWNALKNNGYMILYLNDTKKYSIAEPANLFLQSMKNSSYEGIISRSGSLGYARPVFVWKKTTVNPVTWKDRSGNTVSMKQLFPQYVKLQNSPVKRLTMKQGVSIQSIMDTDLSIISKAVTDKDLDTLSEFSIDDTINEREIKIRFLFTKKMVNQGLVSTSDSIVFNTSSFVYYYLGNIGADIYKRYEETVKLVR